MIVAASRLLGIRPHERGFVALSGLLVMHAMAVNVLSLGTVTALFLGSTSRQLLPVVYAAGAVFGVAASTAVSALSGRVSRTREMAGLLLLLAACLIAALVLLPVAPPSFLLVVHPVATGLGALAVVQAFAVVNDCLDAEQAKRLLPVVGAGGTVGAMAAGGAMAWIAPRFGTDRGMLLGALLACVTALLAARLLARYSHQFGSVRPARLSTRPASASVRPGPSGATKLLAATMSTRPAGVSLRPRSTARPHATSPGLTSTLGELLRSPLLRIFALSQVAIVVASTLLKFALESTLQAQLDVDHIAVFLGLLNLTANAAMLLVQTLIEARLLRAFGLMPGLLGTSLVLGAGGGLLVIDASLAALASVRFVEAVARFSLGRTAEDLVLLPLSSNLRRQAKTFVASTVAPLSVLTTSLTIATLDIRHGTGTYALMIGVGACGVGLALALRGPYLARLRGSLTRRRLLLELSEHTTPEHALQALLETLPSTEGNARLTLLRATARQRLQGGAELAEVSFVAREIAVELRCGHYVRLLRHALGRSTQSAQHASAARAELAFHADRVEETLFLLLTLIHSPEDMYRAQLSYTRGDRRVRAFALEVLAQSLGASLRRDLLPYLSDSGLDEQLAQAEHALGLAHHTDLASLLADPKLPTRLRPLALYLTPGSNARPGEERLMNTLEEVFTLRMVDLFSRLSPEELQSIANIAERRSLDADTPVFREGEPGDAFYVVLKGELSVTRSGNKVATLRAGECFGEMALLDRGLRAASVTTSSACELSRIGDEDFRDLLESYPGIAMAMLAILARRAASLLESRPAGPRLSLWLDG